MLLSIALLPLLLQPQLARAQAVSEYQVKAAYLYNFAKFVDWPAESFTSPAAPIRLCVLNDRPFQTQLEQIVNGKKIIGRPVLAIAVQTGEESRDCQVLFISSSQQPRHIFDLLQEASVLTVGETASFLEEGGIINFVIQGNQVHFEVNHKAATKARLRVSSRLLSLAKTVIE
jgi:YfiR/HmsC-like